MDYIGNKYRNAELVAKKIIHMKKGKCLDHITSSDLKFNNNTYIPSISQWYQLMGYRKNIGKESTIEHLNAAIKEWIRASTVSGSDAAFVITRNNGITSLLYGSNCEGTEAMFKSNISECCIQKTRWREINNRYNGIFTGTFSALSLADILLSSRVKNFYVSCIIVPVLNHEVNKIIETDKEYINILNEYKSYQRVYGTSSRRIENIALSNVLLAIDILREEIEFLEEYSGKGFVRAVVRFGANSENDYREIQSIVQSCFEHENRKGFEPIRSFRLCEKGNTVVSCLAIPYASITLLGKPGNIHITTLQSSSDVVSFCIPSLSSCEGYLVKNYNIDEDCVETFPVLEKINSEVLNIGSLVNCSERAVIPLQEICKHVLVTGSTGSGKTTTVKKILNEIYSRGIPFIVLEGAKKEYYSLMSQIHELQIYTPGNDGHSLSINPLQPEDGVLIENHVAAVVRALLASTGGEHPIPEAYYGLLKQTYSKFGWEYGQMAYTDEYKPFPTFKDVFDNVESYISAHAKYGSEVRQNLTAALSLRAETMYTGALGRLFENNFGLKAEDLLEKPSIIELADFSHESIAFIMNILLFKFQSYLSRLPHNGTLKRLIVVEEAHNVFKKTSEIDNARGLNNDYFDKMFSEIRSSGTGLILSDQRPSIMTDTVIANTSVKIMHSLSENMDREVVGLAANMSKLQITKMSEFGVGECVISLNGRYGLQHANIEPIREKYIFNAACHVCANRFNCKRSVVKTLLEEMDNSLIDYYLSKIKANPYNISLLETNIVNMLKNLNVIAFNGTKLCFLGEVISNYGNIPIQEGRIICNAFCEYLKRRGA